MIQNAIRLLLAVILVCGAQSHTLWGQTVVGPGQSYAIDASTHETFILDGGILLPKAVTISGAIELQGDATIRRVQNPIIIQRGMPFETSIGPTLVTGTISGPGGLHLRNESVDALRISGNNTYDGLTVITAGSVIADSADAFGSTVGGTQINGGSISIQVPTSERFYIESGILQFVGSNTAPADPITVAGGTVYFPPAPAVATPIVLQGSGGEVRGTTSITAWEGGSSGSGDLKIDGRLIVTKALDHDGDLTIGRVTLNVANHYTGDTFVAGEAEVNHAGAFGQSNNITMRGGSLRVNALPSDHVNFLVEDGDVYFPDGSVVPNSITLGGTPDTSIRGNVTYTGNIQVNRSGSLRNDVYGGTFNGTISGDGPLRLIGTVTADVILNTANTLTGSVVVRSGNVQVNHSEALPFASTNVESGKLILNVPATGNVIVNQPFASSNSGTLVLNAAQSYDEPFVFHAGTMEANAEIGIERLIALKGNNGVTTLKSSGAGKFRIDGELRAMRDSMIEAKLTGDGTVKLLGSRLIMQGDLTEFAGNLEIKHGQVEANTRFPAALGNAPISIAQHGLLEISGEASGAPLILDNEFTFAGHSGNQRQTATLSQHGYSAITLRGPVNIGPGGTKFQGSFTVLGQLIGDSLTHSGGSLVLRSTQTSLREELRLVDQASLWLADGGKLHSVEQIVLEEGSTIYLAPSADTDRLDDGTTIRSRGGFLQIDSSRVLPTSETLGTLHLEQGSTRIVASSSVSTAAATLVVNHLDRDPGTILNFYHPRSDNSVQILSGVSAEHGMLGPWAITDTGFATLTPTGRVDTVIPTSLANINASTPDQHVRVVGNQSLNGDMTIASLQSDASGNPDAFNLNGHRLTIASGGVFRNAAITNGEITAGTSGDQELVFHHSEGVAADIVDNAAGGAVSLFVSSNAMKVSGNNSYTGGTWVVGDNYYPSTNAKLTIQSLSAIPANDRVHLNNATYEMQPLSGGVARLSELHVSNYSLVSGSFNTPLDVENMYLEDGRINALLTGAGTITKRTDGTVEFSNSQGSNFTGQVVVEGGLLVMGHSVLPQAEFTVSGGQLDISGSSNFVSNVTLAGGTLGAGRYTGTIDVQSDSALYHNTSTLFYGAIKGSGDLTIRGTQSNPFDRYVGIFGDASQYTGNITVESGALRIGSPSNGGSGNITVGEAGRLILGSNHYLNTATSLNNEIHLYGGSLYSTPPLEIGGVGRASPSVLTGSVTVHDEAFIGALRTGLVNNQRLPGLTFAGELILSDDSHVYGLSDTYHAMATGATALVDIAGDLVVGENTTWHLLTSSLSISGAIRSNSPNASIDFVGAADLLRLEGTQLHAANGQSLAISINGGAVPFALTGAGNSIVGNGTLVGDFSVANHASVSPGNSPGSLTISGNLSFAENGLLSIELGGNQAVTQFDTLVVDGDVTINGGLLDLSLWNGFVPDANRGFIVLRASSISGVFANATNSITVGGIALPVTYRSNMVIVGNLSVVPEPASLFLLLSTAMLVGGLRGRARDGRDTLFGNDSTRGT